MRNVVSEDLYRFEWPSNPSISPDGKHVVFEKTVVNRENDNYETQLWLSDLQGKQGRQITTGGNKNLHATWSPDSSTIAFVSDRLFGSQLWIYSVDKDEERMITRFKYGVSSVEFTPDGNNLYVMTPVKSVGHLEIIPSTLSAETVDQNIADDIANWNNSPKRYKNLYYKLDGLGLQRDLQPNIVLINILTGAYKSLTIEDLQILEYAVSPDARQLAFTAVTENDSLAFEAKLYTISSDGSDLNEIYSKHNCTQPSFSPDGKWISFINGNSSIQQLYVMSNDGTNLTLLSKEYPDTIADLNFTDMRYGVNASRPQWSEDNKYIYALATYQGTNEIVRFSLSGNEKPTTVIGGKKAIYNFAYDGKKTIVTAYSKVDCPGRVSVSYLSGHEEIVRENRTPDKRIQLTNDTFPKKESRLDDCNIDLFSELNIVEPEDFTFTSVDDWHIHGFLLKPANMKQGKKYPVILDIHGGPHSAHCYSYFHQLQLFSANGFVVLYINPRGSSGYGRDFTNAVKGDYGGKDYQDLMTGLDEVIKRYDFIDENNIAVNGISYGGFMTNWIVTKTDRFSVAISEGCISNWISMNGTSDVNPKFIEEQFLSKTDIESLWGFSPLAYVKNVNTPLLLIHAENDLRCPMEQSEQFYTYIKRQNKEVELLRFPNSSHAMLQNGTPKIRIDRLNAMVDWFQQYL